MNIKSLQNEKFHLNNNAKMVPFAGYNMPVQYEGVNIEHHTVRNKVGVFDVSHMGEIFIKGKDIYTPIADCFLNGITRKTVIGMVKQQGFNLVEKYILPDEISNYEEAFLTGTAAEITPIRSIDEVNFNTGDSSTTFKFMGDFSEMVKSSSYN